MVIELVNISHSFMSSNSCTNVLIDINMRYNQGESYALAGPSGSGKSTLLHIIAGFENPLNGVVYWDQKLLHCISKKEYSSTLNTHIGFVFQTSHFIQELSVVENVMLPCMINNDFSLNIKERACALLDLVGLLEKKDTNPLELSGGQKQRACLARALMNNPSFLIADEPTGNLDRNTGNTIIELLLLCVKRYNMGLIITSHDPWVISRMDNSMYLDKGRLL